MISIGISLTDVRRQWFEVLSGIRRGKTYVIHSQGRPIAQLGPYQSPAPTLPPVDPGTAVLDPDLISTLEQLVTVFGLPLLAELLGSPPALLLHACHTGFLSPDLHPRLDFLHDLGVLLRRTLGVRDVRRWMTRIDRTMGGRSPAMLLSGAWRPGTPGCEQVWVAAGGKLHV